MTSYIPRPNKNVILVSTMYSDDANDATTGVALKPEVITYYNTHKYGVDIADQMCATYSVQRNTQRWPMMVFFRLLNISGINSQIIYLGNQLESMPRRVFLKTLAHELTIGEIQRRSQITSGFHTSLQARLKKFLPAEDHPKSPPPIKKRSRCIDCTVETGKRRLSNYSCNKCERGICLGHASLLCTACFSTCSCKPSTLLEEPDSE